jgi:endonuclease YncB( thermonuclease family)
LRIGPPPGRGHLVIGTVLTRTAGIVRTTIVLALSIMSVQSALAEAREGISDSSCEADGTSDRVAGLGPGSDIALASGRIVRLVGFRLPDGTGARERLHAWLLERAGNAIAVRRFAADDRWGRLPARLLLVERQACRDLGEALVEEGLAMVDAGSSGAVDAPRLFALEAKARERGLGLWADDRYKTVPVGQIDLLRERVGRFVLVEGRIQSVGERQTRTYLNFGRDWASDFTIIIPKRTWGLMAAQGMTAAALKGRSVRARGVIEEWQGPALTVTAPAMIEILDHERGQR